MPLHVAFEDFRALRARCEYSTIRNAEGDPRYEDGAVVPRGAWQPITEAQARALAARLGAASDVTVEIVRPPELDRSGFELETLTAGLGDMNARYLGQALAAPGMPTTTVNRNSGRLLGLHLDNWDKLIYERTGRGRRRIALNLGPGARYLVLAQLDAQAACRGVHPADFAARHPHTGDCRAYVAAARLPVHCFRIRIDPGEGYVAPTEYLLHDGSTEGQALPSVIAFWLGRWPTGALPSLV